LLASRELTGLAVRPFPLRPLTREGLRSVVEGPARLAGIGIDEALVERLVEDTGGGEALPLLAFTRSELAEGVGRGMHLSIGRYDDLGGVRGALRRQADAALAEAIAAGCRERREVISGLLRLVTVDDEGRPTRWRVARSDLPDPVRVELDAFVARRLLITDADDGGTALVEVAHEAFLVEWPPLAEAIAAKTAALQMRSSVERAAANWDEASRPGSRLWGGDQLAAAVADVGARRVRSTRGFVGWLPVRRTLVADRVDLSQRACDFLQASITRDRRRRVRTTTILSAALIFFVVLSGIAVYQQREATMQQRLATARQLAAEANSLRNSRPDVSLLLSVEAQRLAPSSEGRASLLDTLLQSPYGGTLRGPTGPVLAVAFSPDGRTLAKGSAAGAMLWDVGDRAHPARLGTLSGHMSSVSAVVFSPDGRTLATGSDDRTAILWDVGQVIYLANHAVALACAMAGPELSRADWTLYVPGLPYERTCP
jgi:hypothetical protein